MAAAKDENDEGGDYDYPFLVYLLLHYTFVVLVKSLTTGILISKGVK